MKHSFTYSGDPKTRQDAIKKARKEGKTFSQLVEYLLLNYVNETKDMGVYGNSKKPTTIK